MKLWYSRSPSVSANGPYYLQKEMNTAFYKIILKEDYYKNLLFLNLTFYFRLKTNVLKPNPYNLNQNKI